MELKIKLQGKNATITGTPKEIKKVIDSMNAEFEGLKKSLINNVDLPEPEKIVQFIEGRTDFQHSMPDILTEFIGTDSNLRNNRKIYDLMFRKSKEARTIIEGKHNGTFKGEKEYPPTGSKQSFRKITVYKFSKSSDGGS